MRNLKKERQHTSAKAMKLNEKEEREIRLERSEKRKNSLFSDVHSLIQCIRAALVEDGEGR